MPVISEGIDRGDTRTLTVVVTAGGVPVDPDALALTIRTPAGVSTTYTYGVDAGVVHDATGSYHYDLTFGQAGAWTYEWRSTNPTQVQGETIQVQPSPLDVVPGTDAPYFTIGEARALSPLNDESKYSDAAIDAMRRTVEQAIEKRAGVAFVPRTVTETIDGNGSTDLLLRPRPISVTTATVGGTAHTGIVLYPTGVAYNPSGWTAGRGNVVITYVHGYATVPHEIKQAALRLTRDWLVDGPIDERVTTINTDDGAYAMATPGLGGTATGLRSVDAAIALYNVNVAVA